VGGVLKGGKSILAGNHYNVTMYYELKRVFCLIYLPS